jgi:head-tail adaptor
VPSCDTASAFLVKYLNSDNLVSMNPAKLDTKILLSRKVGSRDASGAPISTLETIAELWAEKVEQGSALFRDFGLLQAETTTVFKTRFITITEKDFVITAGGEQFQLVVPPYETDGRRAYLLMQARRVA